MIGNTGKQGKEKTKQLLTLGKARNCIRNQNSVHGSAVNNVYM